SSCTAASSMPAARPAREASRSSSPAPTCGPLWMPPSPASAPIPISAPASAATSSGGRERFFPMHTAAREMLYHAPMFRKLLILTAFVLPCCLVHAQDQQSAAVPARPEQHVHVTENQLQVFLLHKTAPVYPADA